MGKLISWRGLLHDSNRGVRLFCLCAETIVCAALTFMQLGFVGIGRPDAYVAYALVLLAPVAVGSMLLGTLAGTIHGLLSGIIFYIHARILPLDMYERYFTTPVSSIVLLGCSGFLLGLIFAFASTRKSNVVRFVVALLGCFLVSALYTLAQSKLDEILVRSYWETVPGYYDEHGARSQVVTVVAMPVYALYNSTASDKWVQIIAQFVLMGAWSVINYLFVRMLLDTRQIRTVRTAFRLRVLAAVIITFLVTSSVGFISVSVDLTEEAYWLMYDELVFLKAQLREYLRLNDVMSGVDMSEEQRRDYILDRPLNALVNGYDSVAGATVMLFDSDDLRIVYSNNPTYPKGMGVEEAFGSGGAQMLERMCETEEAELIPWTKELPQEADGRVSAQLAFAGATQEAKYTLVIVAPFSYAYAQRGQTMLWVSLVALALVTTLYIIVTRMLERVVARPIQNMMETLVKITKGDLDVIVSEVDTMEFATLSAGINKTVDSMKTLIAEAELRTEFDLKTARSIQEGALPRTFPAFPGNSHVDLFAMMDPARDVGGDFYDFFEIDDHTVAFLMADVSGKGIPASLFMMAAKNEIANRMHSDLDLCDAIAEANNNLCENNEAEMFVTVWAATFDWKSGLVTYVNAGHNAQLYRHAGTWEWVAKKCGPALGVFEDIPYREQTFTLEPGDEVLLFTDGVNEAFNIEDEEYGYDRLEAFVVKNPDLDPEELVHRIRADVATWAGQKEQSDDVTILAVKYQ